jgi:hypothetical protein
MAMIVGRLREGSVLDYKFGLLGHNTIRATGSRTLLKAGSIYAKEFIK